MKNTELEQLINDKLNSAAISDYAPNGLQVEGKETVQKIVTGVTASQALLDEAVRLQADAVIVHHGYFWKGESPVIRGMKRRRLKTLLANDINLYGWHLPLDAHPELGNNAQLAALLGITVKGEIEPLVPWGELSMPVPGLELASWIEARLGVNRYGAAIPGQRMCSVSPGVPAAGKVLLIAPPASAWMLLLPARCLNRPFIPRANRGCIFMPPGTMPLNAAVFAP
ncbi:putative hydrolase-oxidase [Salmonella enterica subsp. enterica]|uniref:Putative hydrolase-oxidase n=1 Tax=Salmonella enterica I TaxID=59201 RepID=A0A3S4FD58_SALET|nr:putative hydrolase-oxidase [Salmonella enterica subsp. enterica]